MSEPFLGEIRIIGFNFAPTGWAFCNGQILPIAQNQALFSLIGAAYGGDGQMTFALPDLRDRTPIHRGNGFAHAESGGAETVALTVAQMAAHTHTAVASTQTPNRSIGLNNVLAAQTVYGEAANLVPLHTSSTSVVGSARPHNNMQPSLVLNFCIALQGPIAPQS